MNIQIDGVNNSNKGAQLMMIATLNAIEKYCPEAKIRFNSPLAPDTFASFTKLQLREVQPYWFKRYVVDSHVGVYINRISNTLFAKVSNWKKTSRVDLLIDIGGFQFGDQWNHTKKEILCRKDYQKRLREQGAKIVFMPQAFGPFDKSESQEMASVLNEYSDLLIARDDISLGYLLKTGVNPSLVLNYPDFTHSVSPVDPKIEDHYTNNVCLIPNSMMIRQNIVDEDTYIRFFTVICKFIQENGKTPFLLNHEGVGDFTLCEKINERLNNELFLYTDLNAVETKWIISKSYMVLSSRFHGVANALSSGVPCLATSWNHKYQKIFESYGMSNNVLDCSNVEDAIRKIDKYLAEDSNKSTCENLLVYGKRIAMANQEMWSKVLLSNK
ncbi:polysaccharide pyruvyl transferase family protein [Bacteroides thetaiotaomicron]|uniref:polysaccharide pyruvyl transferase family protein n=1 Tax=Bacteroides thetaiotaomicron TaxID=818 RepID=UPI0023301979|nr:polysaccharide pyruvyl transferase family protein [Bacteroides thetaiotaomicron]MDC2010551.1 polysaccharide pyruvyl transferase family protein [Bacteroides thetaiotaomicron]MDC2020578.1 polysaccharide pyruvyl transferase family protein [Bacteroides thetaiotaomicron]MDC2027878.1 polysaccharide pyruvyl transferase family protein [Bacteroides thetaiotaomicron]MDC2029538.1 polysaccharide pyruvyl transferase family protein [Bacteroides thetaiotaomicron]MDC2060935.1 polysaccharide pyruvyl transfe